MPLLVDHYTDVHARIVASGTGLHSNLGYWTRPGMTLVEATCALADRIAHVANVGPGDRVLEAGCGHGACAIRCAREHGAASVLGIDITENRIQNGIDVVRASGLAAKIDLRVGDAAAFDDPAEGFTAVLAVECAFHFRTRRRFFENARRWLVPGGRLVLADIVTKPGVDAEAFARAQPAEWPTFYPPENLHDIVVYRRYLEETGFGEVEVDVITEQTMLPMAEYLERSADNDGRPEMLRTWRRSLDYVIVSAKRTCDVQR